VSAPPTVVAEIVTTLPTGRVVLFATCPFCGATHVHYISAYEDPASYYQVPSPRRADCGRGIYQIRLSTMFLTAPTTCARTSRTNDRNRSPDHAL
jgi:hypothetical protein